MARHAVDVPANYMPSPQSHLKNARDAAHYLWAIQTAPRRALDVGAWDGWLAALLWRKGIVCDCVELVEGLANANMRYAMAHEQVRHVYHGWFDEVPIPGRYDAVFMFEVLEHIPLDAVPEYIAKAESLLFKNGRVMVSLPDQPHEENRQHQWTPSEVLIRSMWGHNHYFHVEYKDYPGTSIPGNWMASWTK